MYIKTILFKHILPNDINLQDQLKNLRRLYL